MMLMLLFFLIPAQAQVVTPQNITSPCLDQNHIFFVPGVLSAGGSSRACLSRFYPEGQARMVITLNTEEGERVTAFRDLATGDGGCLDISVPQKPNTKADINVNVRYVEANCVWSQRVSVRVASSKLVVLHAERARYRPGEPVRFRVIALKADLTPAHGLIDEVWLEGPQGSWDVKAAQWLRVRTRLGLAQLQHDLDELAPPGKWTLRARLEDGSQGSSTFLVGNYELPPFQLTVRHAPKVLRTSERLSWTVCVRYPWSEAVEGLLVIRIRGAGGRAGDGAAGIRTVVRLRARACHRHAAAAKRVQLQDMAADDIIVADFSFQEDGTRVWQNTTVVSQVVENPVTLEFLTKHRPVISPGLPYKLKIKANRWDDKPAANEPIHVCRSPALTEDAVRTTNESCVDALTDDKGIARVMFTVEEHASPFFIFEASARNMQVRLVAHSATGGGARAALGPLRAARSKSLLPLYVRLPYQTTTPLTVHFVVITRGGTIYRWGATTQCPMSDTDQIHTTSRYSVCPNLEKTERRSNLVITNSSDLDSLLDSHTSKIMLPIKVSHQMCPDSYLFAYFLYHGELVTASKHFEMEECFANTVEATWNTRLTSPGSTASLNIATSGPALCALTALDAAARLSSPPHDLREELMYQLRRLVHTHRNITQYDAAGDCFLTADETVWTDGSDLAASGVRATGAGPAPRCMRVPQSLTEEIATRSDFSEAWLWRLVLVGPNGTAVASAVTPDSVTRYEATAFCLAKTGVALSQPAVLQVFREFFIHADGPKRLRRGDTTIMRYRLFNYLYEPLSVQLTVASDQSLQILERTEVLCVRARSSVARRLTITARDMGDGRLRIRAEPVYSSVCGNATATAASGDEVIIQVHVEPEGVPTHDYKSALICANTGYGSSEESWKWPKVEAVPGTETLTVWVAGDLNGPLLADADSLILLPRGCGEQNMQRLAANYLAARLLPPTAPAALTTRLHLTRGFIRQMQYVHPSGGFSAFGSSDPVASTWLTAFCIRYLRRIHKELYQGAPVPAFIQQAERWLIDQQMENGCFRNEGQVFHRELRGGLDEEGETASVALTAYIIASLMESSTKLPYRVIKNSLSCLQALPPSKTKSSSKIYAHTLLTYALMRLKRYEEELGRTNEASPIWEGQIASGLKDSDEMRQLVELLRMARRSDEYVWWDTGNLATSIEATGYTLLALAECPPALQATCAVDARAAILWLSTHRNAGGGFISTQDTLVALEASIRWSSILPPSTNLTVRIRNGETTKTVSLVPEMKIPNVVKMGASEKLSVSVVGGGCALVQATRSYSSISTEQLPLKSLSLDVAVRTDGPFDCDNNTACFCAAIVDACVLWRGALPAMSLLELMLPAGYGADAGLLYAQLRRPDTLLRRIELSASGGRASLYIGTRDGSDTTPRAGHECFKIQAVGPRVKTKPGYAKILDYYHPDITDTQTINIPEDCPSRINEDGQRNPKYTAFDNLYNKAKSLNGDEILITNDFSFEDIPEGLPLDDPIYDNLIKGNKIDNLSFISSNKSLNELQTPISIEDKVSHETNEDFDNNKESNGTEQFGERNKQIANTNDAINISNIESKLSNNYNTTDYETELINEIILTEANNNDPPVNKTFENATTQYHRKDISQGFIEYKQENIDRTKDVEVQVSTETAKHENSDKIKDEDLQIQTYVDSDKQEYIDKIKNGNLPIRASSETNKQENSDKTIMNKLNHELQSSTDAHPHLSNFHDINYDLDVPSGIEGPVPSVVLPPKDFFLSVQSDRQQQNQRDAHQQFVRPYYIPNYVYIN